jgi:folate-binding protein YgfZ
MTKIANLESRALLRVAGGDAKHFLQNLITCDVDGLEDGAMTFGALLTPQGKILFDFFLMREADDLIIDVEKIRRDDLAKRLAFYKLRADVQLTNDDRCVFAVWDTEQFSGLPDPRYPDMGWRIYADDFQTNASENDWHAHRIAIGIPQSGLDFEPGSLFPHDAMMDQMHQGGVDFTKGCYVGQEVVSRMQHRGTARNRFVKVSVEADSCPPAGTEIVAEERKVGVMGSGAENLGLALVRIDRVLGARQAGTAIQGAGQNVRLERPEYAQFDWPV